MCTAATVVASNADRVDRADQRRPIESAKSINYYTGSRAIVRRTACVEQSEGDVLPALSFELADDPNCFCSIKKAHILKACARLAQVSPILSYGLLASIVRLQDWLLLRTQSATLANGVAPCRRSTGAALGACTLIRVRPLRDVECLPGSAIGAASRKVVRQCGSVARNLPIRFSLTFARHFLVCWAPRQNHSG